MVAPIARAARDRNSHIAKSPPIAELASVIFTHATAWVKTPIVMITPAVHGRRQDRATAPKMGSMMAAVAKVAIRNAFTILSSQENLLLEAKGRLLPLIQNFEQKLIYIYHI